MHTPSSVDDANFIPYTGRAGIHSETRRHVDIIATVQYGIPEITSKLHGDLITLTFHSCPQIICRVITGIPNKISTKDCSYWKAAGIHPWPD